MKNERMPCRHRVMRNVSDIARVGRRADIWLRRHHIDACDEHIDLKHLEGHLVKIEKEYKRETMQLLNIIIKYILIKRIVVVLLWTTTTTTAQPKRSSIQRILQVMCSWVCGCAHISSSPSQRSPLQNFERLWVCCCSWFCCSFFSFFGRFGCRLL